MGKVGKVVKYTHKTGKDFYFEWKNGKLEKSKAQKQSNKQTNLTKLAPKLERLYAYTVCQMLRLTLPIDEKSSKIIKSQI